jgi:hypothetical protein
MGELLGIESSVVKFVIAFVLVMALIGLTAWLIRQFGSARPSSGSGARNRQPRLAVLDSAVVDARRRLVLIRRDNVEHLLMIGGPTDVVVEANVVRAQSPGGPVLVTPAAQRMQQRAPIEPIEPDYDPSLVPLDEPFYEEPAPQRPARPAPAPAARASAPPPPPSAPRVSAPAPQRPVAPPAAPARPQPQFSDMAQRMEAALRAPSPDVPPVRPVAEPRMAPPSAQPRTEPQLSTPAPAAEPQAGDVFANLEEEMANLLKPSGKNPA